MPWTAFNSLQECYMIHLCWSGRHCRTSTMDLQMDNGSSSHVSLPYPKEDFRIVDKFTPSRPPRRAFRVISSAIRRRWLSGLVVPRWPRKIPIWSCRWLNWWTTTTKTRDYTDGSYTQLWQCRWWICKLAADDTTRFLRGRSGPNPGSSRPRCGEVRCHSGLKVAETSNIEVCFNGLNQIH